MKKRNRKTVIFCRLVPLLLVLLILGAQVTQVLATSATTATTDTQAGTSLYAVTTALTAFANNVVGANTNDKHGDVVGDSGVSTDMNHKLWELSNKAVSSASTDEKQYVQAGDAGAIVGYGDTARGFIGYISSTNSRSVTVSSYSSYLGIGDSGKTYVYVRYGRLLNDLGIDETGNPASSDLGRSVGGRLIQLCHMGSAFVPTAFNLSIDALRFLNPFRFLVDQTAVTGAVVGNTSGEVLGYQSNVFDETAPAGAVYQETGSVTADPIEGVDEFPATSGLKKISEFTTWLYVRFRQIGIWIMIPLMAAFLVATLLMTKSRDKSKKTLNFLKKFVFILIGIPLLGLCYTAALDKLSIEITKNAPSSRVIAATFVDFENWVKVARLDPPRANVSLVSEGISDAEAQGRADGTSWRTVRQTIYKINQGLGIYNDVLPESSGLGFSSVDGSSEAIELNAGMWDTDGELTTFGSNASIRHQIFTRMNALLDSFSDRSFYTPGAWESSVNHALHSNYTSSLGQAQSTDPASTNKKTIYQMYWDSDEVDDWMDRYAQENYAIFNGVRDNTDGPEAARWSYTKWNIFSNGTRLAGVIYDGTGTEPVVQVDEGGNEGSSSVAGSALHRASSTMYSDNIEPTWKIYYTHDPQVDSHSVINGMDPGQLGGLSTVAMYNYLSTSFNTSDISVYSAVNTSSEYTREYHYSVNLAGSGFMAFLFGLNCCLCLAIFMFFGLYYCFGMLFHNLKTGFKMLLSIPAAMMGFTKSMVQVVVYVVNMIIQLIMTVVLYDIVSDVILVIASAIETPIINSLSGVSSSAVVGGLFASVSSGNFAEAIMNSRELFMVGFGAVILALVGVSVSLVRLRRPVLMAVAFANLKLMRLMAYEEFVPVFDKVAQTGSLYVWDDVTDKIDKVFCALDEMCGEVVACEEASV